MEAKSSGPNELPDGETALAETGGLGHARTTIVACSIGDRARGEEVVFRTRALGYYASV
jgi:hypothetical protein